MKNFIYVLIRFLALAIPYFWWFIVFVKTDYKGQTYDIDVFILYILFLFDGLIFIEIFWQIFKKNKFKYLFNISLLIFFILLYFILPHRENFS